MTEVIDISKLHGVIKEYALLADKDKSGKGKGKLNTAKEINLFKEMVRRNGKEEELKKQLPNIKGITTPIKKDVNKRIIDLMKEPANKDNQNKLKQAVEEKLN